MLFDDAIAFLDDHVNLEANAGWVHGLSLDNMAVIVDVLGDPHRAAPVIHVTGTNGKGSTTRMIESLVLAHGLTVGTFTSPHLESITERIRLNGASISEQDFGEVMAEVAALESVYGPMLSHRASYFELLTAAAFTFFAREAVEVVVIEVGLLGRFDATNVVESDVAVVTNISKDHTDGAGDWELAIAQEKAGIVKPGSHLVLGDLDDRLVAPFEAEGPRAVWRRDVDFGIDSDLIAIGGHLIDLHTPHGRTKELFVSLHGSHQVDNALLALAAVEAFFDRQVGHEIASEALADISVPGRFEVLSRRPLVVVDVGHNPAGAKSVADTFNDEFHPDGDLTLVVGLLTGREIDEVVEPLAALNPKRVFCCAPDWARARPATEVADGFQSLLLGSGAEVRVASDVATAITQAHQALGPDDALICTGSTYVVGEARSVLQRLLR